jgi:hypothetical protein
MIACKGRVTQLARAPVKRAGSQSHEIRLDSLLESYSCGGRVAQLGEHLLCKKNHTSAASGVAYADARCATNLLNWTEVGPKSLG